MNCRDRHGQIYRMDEFPGEQPPLHPNCRCQIQPMDAVRAGRGLGRSRAAAKPANHERDFAGAKGTPSQIRRAD
ncbi:MAG: hypothetical protein ACOYKJ_00045 [Candidatus Howiella sp.]